MSNKKESSKPKPAGTGTQQDENPLTASPKDPNGMVEGVLASILAPGLNTGLIKFVALIYTLLVFVLLVLAIVHPNIHLFVMLGLALCLGASLYWFMTEVKKVQAEMAEHNKKE